MGRPPEYKIPEPKENVFFSCPHDTVKYRAMIQNIILYNTASFVEHAALQSTKWSDPVCNCMSCHAPVCKEMSAWQRGHRDGGYSGSLLSRWRCYMRPSPLWMRGDFLRVRRRCPLRRKWKASMAWWCGDMMTNDGCCSPFFYFFVIFSCYYFFFIYSRWIFFFLSKSLCFSCFELPFFFFTHDSARLGWDLVLLEDDRLWCFRVVSISTNHQPYHPPYEIWILGICCCWRKNGTKALTWRLKVDLLQCDGARLFYTCPWIIIHACREYQIHKKENKQQGEKCVLFSHARIHTYMYIKKFRRTLELFVVA